MQKYPPATNSPIQKKKGKTNKQKKPSEAMKMYERKSLSLKNVHVRQYSLDLPTETILYQAAGTAVNKLVTDYSKVVGFLALLGQIVNSTL